MSVSCFMKIELVQILRLFAAISIFFYHSGMIGENGYFAVEIFNIISGFIIVYSTQNMISKKHFLKKDCFVFYHYTGGLRYLCME